MSRTVRLLIGKGLVRRTFVALAVLVVALVASGTGPAHASSTFVVNDTTDQADTNTSDNTCFAYKDVFGIDRCTLRAAIQQANATPGADIINFNIPLKILGFDNANCDQTTKVCTITPASGLPPIEDPVTINGYTQGDGTPGTAADDATQNTLANGTNADLKIELNGASAPVDTSAALEIFTSGVTVRGLVINRWSSRSGIWIDGRDTALGSVTADNNKVEGNFIGTNPTGAIDRGNGLDGVSIFEGRNNTVGGTTRAARNVISGNHVAGVHISESSVNNIVQGNLIGTNARGTSALANDREGVSIVRASSNTVGARNVISGNGDVGVLISGDSGFRSGGNKVQGNLIGTAANGIGALGNSSDGVAVVDSSNNTIGGGTAARNVIAFNQDIGVGVYVVDLPANNNRILSNSIHSNGELGIDLVSGIPGVTPNDLKDPDSGPNGFQNKPVLSAARTTGSSITIRGNLNSTPSKTFTIQFFSNPSGNEGRTFLGQKSVTTNSNGNAPFAFTFAKAVPAGRTITTTATGSEGTSEFSGPRTVVAQ